MHLAIQKKPPILWENQLLYLLDEALDGLICEKERLSLALQLSHNDYLDEVFLFLQGESDDSEAPILTQKRKNLLFQFDSLWWIRHSFNFTVSVNDFMQNKFFLGSCNDLFAMDERFFINMSIQEKGKKVYHPFFLQIEKSEIPIYLHQKEKTESYNIWLLSFDPKNPLQEDHLTELLSLVIVKELYPRIYIRTKNCMDCNLCDFYNKQTVYRPINIDSPRSDKLKENNNFCMVGKLLSEKCPCFQKDMGNVYQILNCVFHVCYLYKHRKINSKYTKLEKNNVTFTSCAKKVLLSYQSADGNSKDVSIFEYISKQEEKKQLPKGGHHKPPREHYRTDYYRHCKSGKVVHVRGTVVNKGKGLKKVSFVIPEIKEKAYN